MEYLSDLILSEISQVQSLRSEANLVLDQNGHTTLFKGLQNLRLE
jgi:hypothetical protein